jgi:RNA polymerase sigma-70 factor (ECF subfamily)
LNSRLGRGRLHVAAPAAEPDRDDVDLVRAFVSGESWAARAIWMRHAPMVHRLLKRALGPSPDREDLVQNVFMAAFARIRSLRDAGALRSFIYSIAVRTLKWELRRRRVRRILHLSPTGHLPDLPVRATDSETRQILGRFYLLLDQLGANERAAFVLRHMEGEKLEEIAEHLGVSLATVKRWLNRASQKLSALIESDRELTSYVRERGVEPRPFHAR